MKISKEGDVIINRLNLNFWYFILQLYNNDKILSKSGLDLKKKVEEERLVLDKDKIRQTINFIHSFL